MEKIYNREKTFESTENRYGYCCSIAIYTELG